MLSELHPLYQSIEKRKATLLKHMDSLTDDARHKAAAREWSPLQVMEHLVVVEEWLSGASAAAVPSDAKVGMKGRIFITVGGGIMRSGLRIPTIPVAEPRSNLDYDGIKRRWDATRNALALQLQGVTPETRTRPIALHPVAGPLNAHQVIDLLDAHLDYHLRFLRASAG